MIIIILLWWLNWTPPTILLISPHQNRSTPSLKPNDSSLTTNLCISYHDPAAMSFTLSRLPSPKEQPCWAMVIRLWVLRPMESCLGLAPIVFPTRSTLRRIWSGRSPLESAEKYEVGLCRVWSWEVRLGMSRSSLRNCQRQGLMRPKIWETEEHRPCDLVYPITPWTRSSKY